MGCKPIYDHAESKKMTPLRALCLGAALLLVTAFLTLACNQLGDGSVAGHVRFYRDIELPRGATVVVSLRDTSLADASSVELGRDVIRGASQLPTWFQIAYDPREVRPGAEYSLQAEVRLGEELLYVNDTVHPVITRGAPTNTDVLVVSIDPNDRCIEPLPGMIHLGMAGQSLPSDAQLRIRLVDVSDPDARTVVTETTLLGVETFPISFELPGDGVSISRHRRYELEAEVWSADERLMHIPKAEWRRTWLPNCPNPNSLLVNDVFPVGEFPAE